MENNLQNKEKFFALYWGQKVLTFNDEYEQTDTYLVDGSIDPYTKLYLKDLKCITDEDAIEVSAFLSGSEYFDVSALDERHWTFHVNKGKSHILPVRPCRSDICDYLRSKGYLIPWLDASVDEIIEFGWAKTKEN